MFCSISNIQQGASVDAVLHAAKPFWFKYPTWLCLSPKSEQHPEHPDPQSHQVEYDAPQCEKRQFGLPMHTLHWTGRDTYFEEYCIVYWERLIWYIICILATSCTNLQKNQRMQNVSFELRMLGELLHLNFWKSSESSMSARASFPAPNLHITKKWMFKLGNQMFGWPRAI